MTSFICSRHHVEATLSQGLRLLCGLRLKLKERLHIRELLAVRK